MAVTPKHHAWMQTHWASTGLSRYALLDSTRNPRLRDWLLNHPSHRCRSLWPAPLDQALATYSPYVVSLGVDDDFWSMWLSEGIDQHWGILVEADANIERMTRHFSPFSHTRLGMRTVLNRYYDPRVFGPMFSVFNAAQQQAFAPTWLRRIYWTECVDRQWRLRCLRTIRGRFGLHFDRFVLEDWYAPNPASQ